MEHHDIGNLIRDLRVNRQLTQQQLALLVGVSNKAISKWENDEGMPDIENIKRLASVFNVSIDYLLGGTDIQKKHEVHSWEWINLVLCACSLLMIFLPFVSLDIGKLFNDSMWGEFDFPMSGSYMWQSISGFRLIFGGLSGFSIQNSLIFLSILGWFGANVVGIIWIARGCRDTVRSMSVMLGLVFAAVYTGILLLLAIFTKELRFGFAPGIIVMLQLAVFINESKHKKGAHNG